MIRSLLALTLFFTLSAHTCNKKTMEAAGGDGNGSAKALTSLLDQKWVLTALEGNAISMPEGMEAPWLKLGKEEPKVEGFGGCNNLSGGYTVDGDKLNFQNLAGTKKYCEAVQPTETTFMSALRNTQSFKMDAGELKLLSVGREVASLKPAE